MNDVLLHESAYGQFLGAQMCPVLGCARYADGTYAVILQHTSATMPNLRGPVSFRTSSHVLNWSRVWAAPGPWQDFITSQPVGTSAKVSNRRMTVVDAAEAVPDAVIWVTEAGWISY